MSISFRILVTMKESFLQWCCITKQMCHLRSQQLLILILYQWNCG